MMLAAASHPGTRRVAAWNAGFTLLVIALFGLSWVAAGAMVRSAGPSTAVPPAAAGADAPARGADAVTSFAMWDVMLEPSAPLAAWQVALTPSDERDAGRTTISVVGIEGGVFPFEEPPSYDPAALGAGRLVLGAFALEPPASLPAARFRAATIHVHEVGATRAGGGAPPPLRVRVEAAAGPDGTPVGIEATLVPTDP